METLYGLLLAKRTAFASGGIASVGFSRTQQVLCRLKLDLAARIEYGLNDSHPYQRMGALLLIGWLCGLVSAAEIAYLARHDHCVRRTLQSSGQQLARLVVLALTVEEAAIYREKLIKLRAASSDMMSSFLDGLDGA
ncbi:hypothetical protein OKW98_15760 [Pseudomonas sp. KU26590]|uniref:hypothetical protein n=1 Tax=Pseudomonas sp. KU26590 TaxID=2991051 RepID=UPI00223D69E0|nr:hypothetical protein [Pseudomonas sp. KU26590]UZJ58069.1 hypothetical protein OKW98_15760 [Pseudomonas sp. KU26590]